MIKGIGHLIQSVIKQVDGDIQGHDSGGVPEHALYQFDIRS